MKVYEKNGISVTYEIIYKSIKYIYFRNRNDHIIITANKKAKESEVLSYLDKYFEKLTVKKTKTKVETPKYQLWGISLTEDEFFGNYQHSQKNYDLILKLEVLKMVDTLKPRLEQDLSKLSLKLVTMHVKKLRSKYGLCRTNIKEITLSSFLARINPEYLYYVLLHEYAHLIVGNHSKSFYQVLDKVMINHKMVQKQLRKHE